MRQFTCPKAVTHPSTNRARCRATALIETNALPLHQTANRIKMRGQQIVIAPSGEYWQSVSTLHRRSQAVIHFRAMWSWLL